MTTTAQPNDRAFSNADYLASVGRAPLATIASYLTPVCPDCDEKPSHQDRSHTILHGWVVVGCQGYLVIDPNKVGYHMPHWLSLPSLDTTPGYHTTVMLQLDLDELVATLCDLYCTRGGDEPKPLPELTRESLREAVALRAQSCARGWHEPYYEPDNEDEVALWARHQIRRLLPCLAD